MRHIRNTTLVLSFAIFFMIFANITILNSVTPATAYKLGNSTPYSYKPKAGVIDSAKVMYFVQVSDIHINMNYKERLADFDKLCSTINSTIQPAFVMATGDLTDADEKTIFMFYNVTEAEYQFYNQTLKNYSFTPDFWYSGMGNHEGYHLGTGRPYWFQYVRNETQYAVDVQTSFGTYRMIMMDTNEEYGLNDFFNLMGEMDQPRLDHLETLMNSGNPATINQTIILGHHPSNEMTSYRSTSGKSFNNLMMDGPASVYLNGHIHFDDLFVNRGKITELHCPSLKEDRREYRICAFDNDLFSFTDATLDEWPAIVITNPTDSQFYNTKMPLENMLQQTEIRSLIFTNGSVLKTEVKIDGQKIGSLTAKGNNLYGMNWTPSEFAEGSHNLEISVDTTEGNSTKKIVFSLEGETTPLRQYGSAWLWYAPPMRELFVSLIILFTVFGLVQLWVPKLMMKKNPARFQNAKMEDYIVPGLNWHKRVVEKRTYQSAILPIKWTILLSILSFYPFFGPIYIGQFSGKTIGTLWLYGVFIEDAVVKSELCIIVGLLAIIGAVGFSSYVIGSYKYKVRFRNQFPGVVLFVVLVALVIFALLYNGAWTIFITPPLYLGIGIGGYLIHQLRNIK